MAAAKQEDIEVTYNSLGLKLDFYFIWLCIEGTIERKTNHMD